VYQHIKNLEVAAGREQDRRLKIASIAARRKLLEQEIIDKQKMIRDLDDQELKLLAEGEGDVEAKAAIEALRTLEGMFNGVPASHPAPAEAAASV
jgi:hypothetical protein